MTENKLDKQSQLPGHSYSPAHGYSDAMPSPDTAHRSVPVRTIVAVCLACVVVAGALGSALTLWLVSRRETVSSAADSSYTEDALLTTEDPQSVCGITPVTVSSGAAQYYNMVIGAYVYSVDEGSAAEAAGLRIGDIITVVGTTATPDADSFLAAMAPYSPGDEIVLSVFRDRQSATLTLTAE